MVPAGLRAALPQGTAQWSCETNSAWWLNLRGFAGQRLSYCVCACNQGGFSALKPLYATSGGGAQNQDKGNNILSNTVPTFSRFK